MWFWLAIASMLAYGVLDFLFKVAERRQADFPTLLLYYYWTAALLAFGLFALFPSPIPDFAFMAFFALAQVSFYLTANALKLESLRRVKAVLAYPLFALSGVASAVLAALFLGERLQPLGYAGIALSVVAILLLIENHRHVKLSLGALLALGAMLSLAVSSVITAAVVDYVALLPFIGMAYFFAIGPSFVLERRLHPRPGRKDGLLALGAAFGITNVVAFFTLLNALRAGPASLVLPITSLALLVSMSLSMLVYKEKLSRIKLAAALLALIAIVVMGL